MVRVTTYLICLVATLWLSLIMVGRLSDELPVSTTALSQLELAPPVSPFIADLKNEISGGEFTPVAQAKAEQLAQNAPFAATAYVPVVVKAIAEDDAARTEAASSHILKIDPRNRAARLALVKAAGDRKDYETALSLLSELTRLDYDSRKVYVDEIVKLADTPGGESAVFDALWDQPDWGSAALTLLGRDPQKQAMVYRLLPKYPEKQSAFVSSLATRGSLDQAYVSFLNFLPLEQIQSLSTPYDPTFQGLTGAKPFNWSAHRKHTSYEPDGGLSINFTGKRQLSILQQTSVLSAGTYDFTARMRGQDYRGSGTLNWMIRCVDSREPLFDLEITQLSSEEAAIETRFIVPSSGCKYQTIILAGIPGEYRKTIRAELSSVRVERVE
ncbi:MAG: hypothetical protein AAF768_06455 [Pseudomonadota bacterium]